MKKTAKKPTNKQIIAAVNRYFEAHDTYCLMIGTTDEREDFAPAIIGVRLTPTPAVVYNYDKLVKCFMQQNEWDYETAVEWVDYNVLRALPYYKKDHPPIVISRAIRMDKIETIL